MPLPWLKPQRQNPPPLTHVEPNPFLKIQSHFNSLLSDATSLKAHLDSAVQSVGGCAWHALQSGLPRLSSPSSASCPAPWAWVFSSPTRGVDLAKAKALSIKYIEERLAGVPVYTLSNAAEEFVLVSGARKEKSLGLFCFKEEDAEMLLQQLKSMNQDMRSGSKVVPVALNKVVQLNDQGVAFRFIPDSTQVENAISIMVKENGGNPVDDFLGVPVFQSRRLVLRSQNKRYRPFFFRMEDLNDSLLRASREQKTLIPRRRDIQVSTLEVIIKAIKENNTSKWNDAVFIPPGFNVPTSLSASEKN